MIDVTPYVQILDAPVPQTGNQLLDVFRLLDTQMPVQQVIAVPKISLDRVPQRLVERRLPQMVEQLVDVPTVLSYALLQQRTAEQLVNTPRLGGRRFLGSLPGQVSTVSAAKQTVDIPVPGRGGFHNGDQQGFLPVHNPSAQSAEQIVDSSVPRGCGRRSQGFPPGQSSTASVAEQLVDISVPGGLPGYGRGAVSSTARRGAHVRGGGVQDSVPGQSSPALGRADVRGRFRGRLSVPLGSRSCVFIQTSAGDFPRVPVTWYDCFPTGASVSYTVRVGLDGVMEADDIEFGPG